MTDLLTVVPATEGHARELAPRLRKADRQEIEARSGEPPLEPLLRGLEGATCLTVLDENSSPIAMAGAAQSYDESVGIIWMMGSDALVRYWPHLIMLSPAYLDAFNESWPILHNFVDARNTLHIRWLTRVGFKVLRTIPDFGVQRKPFHEIVRVKGHV